MPSPDRAVARRTVLAAACGTCAAAVAGCTTYTPAQQAPAPPVAAAPAAAPPAAAPPAAAGPAAAPVDGIAVADVPVGGGTVFADRDLVVTRPTDAEVRAFSATCTHQGCPVTSVTDGAIVCTCHGSTFSVDDGRVLDGPATQPLAAREFTVQDGVIGIV